MQVKIDNSSDWPVYQQIIDQVKRDIALGRLKSGEKLPTVRELAAQLAINPNTIAKAYRFLERDGIISTRPGAGAYVADLSSNLSMAVRKKFINAEIERLIVEAIHMDIDKNTLDQWFGAALDKFKFGSEKG
jgi:GntR family transcriptional regulator